ncbi:hypothetical protein IG631_15046 [Alternaria alternata]|nr:hypothetical protein IG631_15046 [Alternaria alternata]
MMLPVGKVPQCDVTVGPTSRFEASCGIRATGVPSAKPVRGRCQLTFLGTNTMRTDDCMKATGYQMLHVPSLNKWRHITDRLKYSSISSISKHSCID